MKKYLVELSITRTFETTVVIEGDFDNKKETEIQKAAEMVADNMDHGLWDYKETEFEVNNFHSLPDNLTKDHITLLECGYPLEMIKDFTEEDAAAELDALRS